MSGSTSISTKKKLWNGQTFINNVFSWSLDDIFDKHEVESIGLSFHSVQHYLNSFVPPLLEETRAQLCSCIEKFSSLPCAKVLSLEHSKSLSHGRNQYRVETDTFSGDGKELYKPGGVFVLANFKPQAFNDLKRSGNWWSFVLSTGISKEGDTKPASALNVISKNPLKHEKPLFMIFLMNITTNKRIWTALHMDGNSKLIHKISCDGDVVEESPFALSDDETYPSLLSQLNDSQKNAIRACLSSFHCSKSTVNFISGPPGSGKTKTLATLLFPLLKMNRRTLVSAPTNVAIKEVASRVLSIVRESYHDGDALMCNFGDMLLFGNHDRLNVGADIQEIYLDYRVSKLLQCFNALNGWKQCFLSMIDLLENFVSHYYMFIENPMRKEQAHFEPKFFLKFLEERFLSIASPLKEFVSILCLHLPKSCIMEQNLENLVSLIHNLESFQDLLLKNNIDNKVLEELFISESKHNSHEGAEFSLCQIRTDCLFLLRTLEVSLGNLSLPNDMTEESIKIFCLQASSLIFSTASSSFILHYIEMEPLDILVIDEAAQLKECESVIPLLLPKINHVILVGDELQLPAMVESSVSFGADFGRSLFARLTTLGHPNHFLNIQYRMHPEISSFPNSTFYPNNDIENAPDTYTENCIQTYLPEKMFGPYSFIDVSCGTKELDDAQRCRKNMVEVAVVMKIIKNCFTGWSHSNKNHLSIGVVSLYASQVVAIKDMLGHKYDKHEGFNVTVKTIDGFQGGEQDMVIFSTAGAENIGSTSFDKRTKVALTRARYCLWILGNESALVNEKNIWKDLVMDAKKRNCFFDAGKDPNLAKAIVNTKKQLNQLDDLLNVNSVIFKSSIWKVLFSDIFLKSFKKLPSKRTKESVIDVLIKLSSGWRPKKRKVDLVCGKTSQMLQQYKVEGLFVVCSKDILDFTQVLRIWDILPSEDIPKVVKRLDSIFGSYTDDFISRCSEKCLDNEMKEIPMAWDKSDEIIKIQKLDDNGNEAESSCYVEDSKVDESFLLMKFYPVSAVVVNYLLSDSNSNELEHLFEVSEQEHDIINFPSSTFVLGRSGTGKTTVLTMKLFKREEENAEVPSLSKDKENEESSTVNDRQFLRQLFVTVSPKLCQAVKQQIVRMKRFISGGDISDKSCSIEEEDIVDVDTSIQFNNIPDSFVNLPPNSYPLVITFHKFLMMLDGTVGNSYFERFSDLSFENLGVRSVALDTFIRKKEVTYERFNALYWPQFNSKHTKMLDSSRVFTEIVSNIKGGQKSVDLAEGKLSRSDYLSMSENRASTLSKQKRETIYDIYEKYERMKMDKGDFDMADIVADLHRRLRINKYEGDDIHFVYIDEVQDLTMSQIALLKHVCQNVEAGFVFCGDTAQTIARGIDFRFEDIKSLFYNKFMPESETSAYNQAKDKADVSETFVLNQNFRTHSGVLALSQSTIELLSSYFPHSIDVLKPETSLIYGEAPVVLDCGSRNAVVTIFGNTGHDGGKFVGFGAEQVILVRDDNARKEILNSIGKQALVLTVLECKGLEFQDVLLYNFFGTSPMKNQWRVVYGYMEKQGLLEPKSKSYPNFNDSKHNILCSELKQLYVAITRTRQRLWICEETEEYCRPMFDYWKTKCLVQFKELDDTFAQTMKVASSPEEWKSRGKKLYYERNYEMATMCFENARDFYWGKMSKATGLRETAKHLQDLNPKNANAIFREAAGIFESIGMTESAAKCFSDSGDYEKAGKLYIEKGVESDLKRAGDYFCLAGSYEMALKAYTRGNFFPECLNVCAKGGWYDIGLDFFQQWKESEGGDQDWVDIKQKFLENCACSYFDKKDIKSVMKCVNDFRSIDFKRDFLRSLSLLDELLELEKKSGNYMEAVNIAKMMGNILCEADLYGKTGDCYEAYELVFFYVLSHSLWSEGSNGWPLKQFTHKAELLEKALTFAKKGTSVFHELASTEAKIVSNKHEKNIELIDELNSCRYHKSVRGEILCLWKLLDSHLRLKSAEYVWPDDLFALRVEGMIRKDQFSVESLYYCWTCWKDKIVEMLEYLSNFQPEWYEPNSHVKFALNYLGVQNQWDNLGNKYLLLIPDANWVKNLGHELIKKNGRLVSIDVQPLLSYAQRYWSSELLSVGMDVLRTLNKLSNGKTLSELWQIQSLLQIFEVSKFLLKSNCFRHAKDNLRLLEKYSRKSIDNLGYYIIHLDWKKSLEREMVYQRASELWKDFLKEVICNNTKQEGGLTDRVIGRLIVMILGTGNINDELFAQIRRKFEANTGWTLFIENFRRSRIGSSLVEKDCMRSFYEALKNSCEYNWIAETDFITPGCFMYLVERLLLWISGLKGYIYATKSSFTDWLICQDQISSVMQYKYRDINSVCDFLANWLNDIVYDQARVKTWLKNSKLNVKNYFPLLVLRVIVCLCLIQMISGTKEHLKILRHLLEMNDIADHLPIEFSDALTMGEEDITIRSYAKAFKVIGNPLVIARLWGSSKIDLHGAVVYLDLTKFKEKEPILNILYDCTGLASSSSEED
ncbi:hypothetical protein RYX36_033003 [Vicia faba]